MYKVRCKDEGKGSTTYSDKTEALQACNDRAECTSVVSDAYSDPKKFELCNGLKYERYEEEYKKAWRKRCELL